MKNRSIKKIMIIAGLSLLAAGCYNDKYDKLYPAAAPTNPNDPCDTATATITYSGNIHTILANNCAISGCHNAASVQGGYDFSTWTDANRAALDESLLGTIQGQSPYPMMPETGAPLSTCAIAQITKWVHNGALNN